MAAGLTRRRRSPRNGRPQRSVFRAPRSGRVRGQVGRSGQVMVAEQSDEAEACPSRSVVTSLVYVSLLLDNILLSAVGESG